MSPTAGDNQPDLAGTATTDGVGVSLTGAVSLVVKIRRPDGSLILGVPTLGDQTTAPGSWSRPWAADERALPGVYQTALVVEKPAGRFLTYGPASDRVGPALTGPAFVPPA